MSKMPELEVFEYAVTLIHPGTGAVSKAENVLASYFQETGAYTVFKDEVHTAVAAFRTELVIEIRRSEGPVDDA